MWKKVEVGDLLAVLVGVPNPYIGLPGDDLQRQARAGARHPK